VRDARQENLVEIAQHVRERLSSLRWGGRQATADLTRLDLREHREVSDALEVTRRPFECSGSVLSKRHFRSFSICGQVRVFST
jgi:hypothetical protein